MIWEVSCLFEQHKWQKTNSEASLSLFRTQIEIFSFNTFASIVWAPYEYTTLRSSSHDWRYRRRGPRKCPGQASPADVTFHRCVLHSHMPGQVMGWTEGLACGGMLYAQSWTPEANKWMFVLLREGYSTTKMRFSATESPWIWASGWLDWNAIYSINPKIPRKCSIHLNSDHLLKTVSTVQLFIVQAEMLR